MNIQICNHAAFKESTLCDEIVNELQLCLSQERQQMLVFGWPTAGVVIVVLLRVVTRGWGVGAGIVFATQVVVDVDDVGWWGCLGPAVSLLSFLICDHPRSFHSRLCKCGQYSSSSLSKTVQLTYTVGRNWKRQLCDFIWPHLYTLFVSTELTWLARP